MGIWNWIKDQWWHACAGDSKPGSPGPGGSRAQGDCAVAVAEPPDAEESKAPEHPWWKPEDAVLTQRQVMERRELSTEGRALESLLVSYFDGHDLSLPPLLRIAEALLPKLADEGSDLRTIANGLGEDQVIAAAVLRMANCPLYRGLNKITTLPPAACRLGVRALRTLLMHESLRAATFFKKGSNSEWARVVWRRSLASACVMRTLSDFTKVDREDAFMIGLLHDIGNVIVLRIVLGAQSAHTYNIDLDTFHYLCQECHQEFGELIAKAWSLPSDLTALIANHHHYPAADDPLREQRLLLELSDMIISLLGYAPSAPYDLLESRAAKDLQLSYRDDFLACLEQLPEEVDGTVQAL